MHSLLFLGAAPPQAVKSRFSSYHIQSWWLYIQRTDISRDESSQRKKKEKATVRQKI